MPNLHTVFGLRIRTDCPLPGLLAADSDSEVDVQILRGCRYLSGLSTHRQERWYDTRYEAGERGPAIWRVRTGTHDHFRMVYPDGSEFVVEGGGTHVWACWPDGATAEDTATYLIGPVLGFILRLRSVTAFHASAVEIDGKCILLIGGAGAGKSTTAAAFTTLGHAVLADDIAALTEGGDGYWIQPGYPRVNLWPASVGLLFGSPDTLPRISPLHPTWDKRYLSLAQEGYRFQSEALPLSAVYLLGERRLDLDSPYTESVIGAEAILKLVANTYANGLLSKELRAREFGVIGGLVGRVPVRRVVSPPDPTRVWDLCRTIADDCRRLSSPKLSDRLLSGPALSDRSNGL
jgi:hypothetical protein